MGLSKQGLLYVVVMWGVLGFMIYAPFWLFITVAFGAIGIGMTYMAYSLGRDLEQQSKES